MKKILDRYIIKNFIGTFLFTTGILMSIVIVIDISEKIDNFLESQPPLYDLLVNYYLQFILFYSSLFSPIVIFLSAIISTSKFSNNTEVVAMMSGGMSFKRFFRPYLLSSMFLVFIALVSNHWIIPESNKIRLKFENKYVRKSLDKAQDEVHLQIANNEFIYLKNYNPMTKSGFKFTYERYDSSDLLVTEIKANHIRLEDTIQSLEEYTVKQRLEDGNYSLKHGFLKDTLFKFNSQDISTTKYSAFMLNYIKLKEFIKREKFKGSSSIKEYMVEMYQRSSLPFSTFILVFMAVVIAHKKKRGGLGLNIALGITVAFMYIFFMKIFTTFATNANMPAVLAVWTPNFLFMIVAFGWYKKECKV